MNSLNIALIVLTTSLTWWVESGCPRDFSSSFEAGETAIVITANVGGILQTSTDLITWEDLFPLNTAMTVMVRPDSAIHYYYRLDLTERPACQTPGAR